LRLTTLKSALATSVNKTMARVSSARIRNPSPPVDAQHAQPVWAEHQTNRREHDRAADPGPLDPAGDRAVNEEERGQHRGILVHLRNIPRNAL
jgi:hypothetical protein